MAKSQAMERQLDEMAKAMFGRERTRQCCVCCGNEQVLTWDFRDNLSRTEFDISGLCQMCQDSVFGEEE